MKKRRVSSLLDDPPLSGTGRLSILAGGFLFVGFAAGLEAAGVAAALFVPRLGWTTSGNPWVALASAVVLSAACVRTGKLLDQRRKAGAALAGICFLMSLTPFLGGAVPSHASLVLAGVGLLLLLSVWSHLD